MGFSPLAMHIENTLFLKTIPEVQISFQVNWVFTPLDFYQLFFFPKNNCLKIVFYPTYIFEIAYL